jgi:hypothetical protein
LTLTARRCHQARSPGAEDALEAKHSQTEEELRVAFEELQVLAEELEVANSGLLRANEELESRVEDARARSPRQRRARPQRTPLPDSGRRHAATCVARGGRRRLDLVEPAMDRVHGTDRWSKAGTWAGSRRFIPTIAMSRARHGPKPTDAAR